MSPPPGPAVVAPSPARFAALHERDYRRYFALSLLSMTADNIEHVISYWVIFQKFHSPTLGGFAVISHWLPFLLFSVYTGALADRYDCRKLIQVGQALFMLASLTWGVLFLTDSLRIWHAAVILLVHGAAGVIISPAVQLIIHDVVRPGELPSAIRLGPAIGGGLMLLLGPAWGLLTNVLLYLPFTIFLMQVPYTGHARHGAAPRPARRPRLADSWRVLGEVRADRRIVTMIVLGGATSFFVGNAFQAQMPAYAHDLGADDAGAWYSLLLTANAAGAIAGTLLLETVTAIRPTTRTAIAASPSSDDLRPARRPARPAALRAAARLGPSTRPRTSPVWLPATRATCSGVPSATTVPPPAPPSGPRSMIQSAVLITSRLCSITITVFPWSTSWLSTPSSLRMSSKCNPVVGSSRM